MATEIRQIQVRRDTASNWTSTNPTLAAGEIGFETDTNRSKIGNGSLAWASLPYLSPALRSYLAANQTYNNTATLASSPMSVTVEAGAKYEIELIADITSAIRDIALDFGGTATITNFIGQYVQHLASDGSVVTGTVSRVTSAATDFPGASDGADSRVIFKGTVEVNAAGTFLVRAAQRVANASDTVLLRGSILTLVKI